VLPSLDGRVGGVTARALAPLSLLVDWSRELLLKSAVGVFLKGEDWAAELTDSQATDSFQVRTFASRTHSSGRIVAITRDFGV
jgi:16S rRNA (guanine527-N7)-methyltransferase